VQQLCLHSLCLLILQPAQQQVLPAPSIPNRPHQLLSNMCRQPSLAQQQLCLHSLCRLILQPTQQQQLPAATSLHQQPTFAEGFQLMCPAQ
jgi:hypothetical protein